MCVCGHLYEFFSILQLFSAVVQDLRAPDVTSSMRLGNTKSKAKMMAPKMEVRDKTFERRVGASLERFTWCGHMWPLEASEVSCMSLHPSEASQWKLHETS